MITDSKASNRLSFFLCGGGHATVSFGAKTSYVPDWFTTIILSVHTFEAPEYRVW